MIPVFALQIQPTDAPYRNRIWTKEEFNQLQTILHQLYPYCVKLNQVISTNESHYQFRLIYGIVYTGALDFGMKNNRIGGG